MNNKININPSSTKWLEKDDRVVADYFCDLGFRSLKQILDMRVFDLMNMQGLNAVRVEEVIICLYKWLNPNTAIDEAIYNGMMSQPFLYRGFTMELYFEAREYKVRLKGELGYPVTLGTDTFGNITRLDNALEGLPKRLEMNEMELDNLKKQFETAKVDVERPFPQEEELKAKTDRLNELNALLNVDKRENEIVGGEPDEGEEPPEKKPRDLER